MGKPTFSYTFPGNNVVPCIVEFTNTPQMPEEEIYLFDFKDGILYGCEDGERIVRHTYKKAGKYPVTAISKAPYSIMSDPVEVTVVSTPIPDPETSTTIWDLIIRFLKWLRIWK